MPPAARPKAPACSWTEEAKAILTELDAAVMVRAIAVVEKNPSVDLETLACLGMGTTSGVQLQACRTGAEHHAALKEISQELYDADSKALRTAFATTSGNTAAARNEAVAAIARKAVRIVAKAVDSGTDKPGPIQVTVKDKEDDKEGTRMGGNSPRGDGRREWPLAACV